MFKKSWEGFFIKTLANAQHVFIVNLVLLLHWSLLHNKKSCLFEN